jgi:hypothetical protein
MDARLSGRVIVDLPAEIICGERRYAGSIENLSVEGAYVVTAPLKSPSGISPDAIIEMRIHLPSGEKLNLNCKIKWSYLTPPHGYTNSIGLEILDPPPEYKEYLKALQ